MSIPLLRADQLSRDLPAFRLGPISIEIEPGLIYALVGPNGSGKTTLFRLLMGLMLPHAGSIERFGTPLASDDLAQQQRIGYVPEALVGHDGWSLREITELYRRTYPQFNPQNLGAAHDGLDSGRGFSELSKGQQRRAMLGLALASQPDLLLLDEPTDGIDPFARQDVLSELSSFMDGGDRSMLIATHNLDDVRRIADVVIVLENGVHLGTWEKDELLEGWQRIWLASAPERALNGEVQRIAGAGVQIVTRDLAATRTDAASLGIDVVQTQPLDLVESLRFAMKIGNDRASPRR